MVMSFRLNSRLYMYVYLILLTAVLYRKLKVDS